MKLFSKLMIVALVAVPLFFFKTGICSAKMSSGTTAPLFSLKDVNDKSYDLSDMKDKPLMIIYFFGIDASPSIEGLLILDKLAQKYKDADFNVWGITRSDKIKVQDFVREHHVNLPVLIDNTNISDLYNPRKRLPTMFILGPELVILKHLEGTSRHHEDMLIELAEAKLNLKQPKIAQYISNRVLKRNPNNSKAIEVKAKTYLNKGNFEKAKKMAEKLIAQKGTAAITGKLILAEIYIHQENTKEALKIIEEVKKKAPNRAWPYVLKGDILYGQGSENEAVAEYQAGTKATAAESFYIAKAHDRLALINLRKKQYKPALEHGVIAEKLNPTDIETTMKIAQIHEEEGRIEEAREAYKKAQILDKNDLIADVLAKKAQEMLDLKKRDQRNQLIKELVEQLKDTRNREDNKSKSTDDWTTSRLMTLHFYNIEEVCCGIPFRQGLAKALPEDLEQRLMDSGRVYAVPQDILNEVLLNLKSGASDLTRPETRLQLGRLYAARVMVTGKLYYHTGYARLSLRLTDIETGLLIPNLKLTEIYIKPETPIKDLLSRMKEEILSSIIENYPLQAKVIDVNGSQVTLNIGRKEGVVKGGTFGIVEDEETLQRIKIKTVKSKKCLGEILSQNRPVKIGDRLKEIQ